MTNTGAETDDTDAIIAAVNPAKQNPAQGNREGTADLRALANPVRLTMLTLLRDREWTMAELATELGLRKGSISYHLRVLERAGIVRQSGERNVRGGHQQLWALSAASMAGSPESTTPRSRSAVLRALASQMEASASQRLLVCPARLDAAGKEKAIVLLEAALASIRELETEAGDVVTLGAFTFGSAAE
ncbi:winged helix-turn-helix transcriptional regulator [Salinibacterium sp. NG253]|uniref:ArsR/SmtB family transcription factor n=1 Tax=Salinibacterium sp. NG253 TaxID=2792039 RepID=UPI0018CD2037|nr:metalloregulator ArsR/SmtB family transcription factor [Salinibacterium sp. NG253]MBH0115267.1 winged helix-turn-helix transcriptional regulator [Salinibacterium sp. NG253]